MRRLISIGSPQSFYRRWSSAELLVPSAPEEPYSRQLLIPQWDQEVLGRLTVTMIGAGAASILAVWGVRVGWSWVKLTDGDRLSPSNWPRQAYPREQMAGVPAPFKVFALGERLLQEAAGPIIVEAHARTVQAAIAAGADLSCDVAVCLVD